MWAAEGPEVRAAGPEGLDGATTSQTSSAGRMRPDQPGQTKRRQSADELAQQGQNRPGIPVLAREHVTTNSAKPSQPRETTPVAASTTPGARRMTVQMSVRSHAGSMVSLRSARRPVPRSGSIASGRCETCVQRSCVRSVLGGEGLETRPLFSCGPLRRIEPLSVGQAGAHQVDGPA